MENSKILLVITVIWFCRKFLSLFIESKKKLTTWSLWNELKSSILAPHVLASAINPDVCGDDFAIGELQGSVSFQQSLVDQSVWRFFQGCHLEVFK